MFSVVLLDWTYKFASTLSRSIMIIIMRNHTALAIKSLATWYPYDSRSICCLTNTVVENSRIRVQ